MKAYPITEGELSQILGIGLLATICFSVGAGFLGFALDVTKDLSLAPELPPAVTGFWEAAQTTSWIAGGVLFVVGVGFLIRRHMVLNGIKNQAIFPED